MYYVACIVCTTGTLCAKYTVYKVGMSYDRLVNNGGFMHSVETLLGRGSLSKPYIVCCSGHKERSEEAVLPAGTARLRGRRAAGPRQGGSTVALHVIVRVSMLLL